MLKPRKKILTAALEDPHVCQRIAQLAIAGQGKEKELKARAQKYLLEIAADYNDIWLRVWDKILSRLWQILYDDFLIDQKGLSVIQELTSRMPCVIVPCHRSHVDYLILSHIFYKQKMPLPYVAAGDNMNFWPLGYIFRQSGAFFLRRSFRGDLLYTEVFTAYLKCLLQEGTLIEFFLEGGRSRTGKMLMPKYGMLSMIIHSYQDRISDDLALIPVYLGYDRIIEEDSYLKELRGISKKTESLFDLFKSASIMRRHYGNVYVNVGTPIFLKSYLGDQPKPIADMAVAEQQALYRHLGAKIVSEINRISVVTPVALVAASLLCLAGQEITLDLLRSVYFTLYDYLRTRHVNTSPRLEEDIISVLALFQRWGLIICNDQANVKQGRLTLYLLPAEKRSTLEYYKNNILHHFLFVSLACLSILSCHEEATVASMQEDHLFLKNLLKNEFTWEANDILEVEKALSYIVKNGYIVWRDGRACPQKEARTHLNALAGLLGSLLEAYRFVFNAFSHTEEIWETGKDLPDKLRRRAARICEKDDIGRPESRSREYYKNALNLLQEEGIIEKWDSPEKGVVHIRDKERLADFSLRLAKFKDFDL